MKKPIFRLRGALAVACLAMMTGSTSAQYANGLIAYWPFDGDLLDTTDTGAHGTFVPGSGDQELRFAPGQFGDGINLNDFAAGAFDQYVTVDQVDEGTFDFAGESMTVSLWASTPFLSIDNQTIIGKGSGGQWRLSRSGADSTAAFHGGIASPATGDPLLHFIDDTLMHHIVGVVEAGVGVRLYIDGQLVGAVNGNAQLSDGETTLAIGADPGAPGELFRPWEGVIDDVAIWNRALTGGEIATLYNNGSGVSVAEALNPVDTDEDGMPDFYENTNGLDPNVDDANGDLDNDGLSNIEEFNRGLNPQSDDTDEDGLTDGSEINEHSTDPTSSDSDADGLTDGEEVTGSLNPFLEGELRDPFDPESDPAGDPTNPNSPDSDEDSFADQVEIEFKSDPNDINDTPSPWQIGLKGYWKLDKDGFDASGDDSFPDSSGRGFFGKLAGTSETPLWFNSPINGSVIRLDGTDQRVEIQGDPDEFSCAGGNITVSAWFLTPAWGKSWQAVVAKGEGNNWRVHRNGGSANMAFAGGRADISGGGNMADFKWHHVLAQSEFGVGTRLYVDGEQVATGPGSNLTANGQATMIGGNPDTAGDAFRTLFGVVTEVAIWSRLLAPTEISVLYDTNLEGSSLQDLIDGADSDDDGMPDWYENVHGLDPEAADGEEDADEDGLTNIQEFRLFTDPNNADTDGDGLTDSEEVAEGTSPTSPDSDGDGLSDSEELDLGTDPNSPDTDGDGETDGAEINLGFDPLDGSSVPPEGTIVIVGEVDTFESPDDLHLDPDTAVVAVDTYGDFNREINGVLFQTDTRSQGSGTVVNGDVRVVTRAANQIDNWAVAPAFTGDDPTSVANLAQVMRDIRWEAAPNPLTVDITGLDAGQHYEIQLLFSEGADRNRHWDIAVEDRLVVDNITSEGLTEQVWTSTNSAYYKAVFEGPDDGELNIVMKQHIGGRPQSGSDNNPILQAVIVHTVDGVEPADPPQLRIAGAALISPTELQINVSGIPPGQTYHLRQSTDGENFVPLDAPFDFDSTTEFPASVPVDPGASPEVLYQIFEGASVP